jgi:membrane protein YdbS with pleckstrin-like domain
VIYSPLRGLILRVLAAPTDPPDPPAGSPGSVTVFRASPRFLTLQLLRVGVVALITLFPEGFGLFLSLSMGSEAGVAALTIVLFIALVFTTLHYFIVRLDYDMRYYVVTDRSLRIREGALVIRESTFTFANVQNVSVEQGPLSRLLGIASVRIETAGGGGGGGKEAGQGFGGHRGVLAGIDNASEVRDQILNLLKAYRDGGLGDREDHKPSRAVKGFSPLALTRLREIRDELRALRNHQG